MIPAIVSRRGGRYVDGTVGAGGHALRLLEAAGPEAELIAIDQDPDALEVARQRLAGHADRVRMVQADHREIGRVLDEAGWTEVDGILLDLGVSSMQLAESKRGFSFSLDGPLDMRMDPTRPRTALDLVERLEERELERLIAKYGQDRYARRIARAIVRARQRAPIRTTGRLAEVVAAAVPGPRRRPGGPGRRGTRRFGPRLHPATRTFQALRIEVNDELGTLEAVLPVALGRLAPGGRLAVIAFHSLEDRLVKTAFREAARSGSHRLLTRKPVRAEATETAANPRARSARLRVIERAGGNTPP